MKARRQAASPPPALASIATMALVGATVAAIIGVMAVWAGFTTLLHSRERLFDQLQPASVDAQRLQASVLDQETGIRGYALTRDDRLLAPYRAGRSDQARVAQDLRAVLRDEPHRAQILARLDAVEAGMASWRSEIAEPILAGPVAPERVDQVFLRSKASFDEVRAALSALDGSVVASRAEAREELDQATARLVATVAAAMGALVLVSVGGAMLLRRGVVRPIDNLVDAADGVVLDRLDEPIVVDGPAEIEHLATQVSAMRDRIVSELSAAHAARLELDAWATELARSNADLEQFAYVASHDLQEPLRKVASFCQLLEQRYGDALDDRGRSYIEFAVDGAKRMQVLISDLLDFSRVGRSDQALVPCDLEALARDVVAQLSPDELGDGRVCVGALPTVPGDPTLSRALLQNLVGNALKYRSSERPLVVRLTAARAGDHWEVACTDNGLGIDARYRDRVFVIFQRLHGRDQYEGTGIGLALCKRIVEFSGGRIWIDDPGPAPGTIVRFTVPADGRRPGPHRTPATAMASSPPPEVLP